MELTISINLKIKVSRGIAIFFEKKEIRLISKPIPAKSNTIPVKINQLINQLAVELSCKIQYLRL